MRKLVGVLALLCLAGCSFFRTLGGAPPAYVVFFTDKNVTLTADARTIVDNAANAAKKNPIEFVQLTGPSTRAATGYDPTIAEARMRIVEQTLISDGVPAERQFRTEPTPDTLKNDKSGGQRVEIRIVDTKPASS